MLLHDDILDNALAGIEATSPTLVTKLLVAEAGSSALCAAVTIDGGNFTGPAPGSPDGRQLIFATYASNPLTAIAINAASGGSATKIQLLTAGSQVQVEADITSAPKAVSSGDTVSVGSFTITFRDAA
jgi:hypothetical protein